MGLEMLFGIKEGDTVRYAAPTDAEESRLRFVVLDVSPRGRVEMRIKQVSEITSWWHLPFAPVEVVRLSTIERCL